VTDWAKFDAGLSAADRAALELSMRLARKERDEQLDRMLEDRPWAEVATFASYSCQIDFLELQPWQSPPMCGDTEPIDDNALRLLSRMLRCGISRYAPNPVGALRAAEARGREPPPA
jgi:hypothetical protein